MHTKLYLFVMSLIFVVITPSSFCESPDIIFYSGDLDFDIDDTYNAGDSLNMELRVVNQEQFPISDAYLVIDLVSGSPDPVYPAQASDADNIINEDIITGIDISPDSGINIFYSYIIPGDLKSGTYRLDIYLRTEKTPIVGVPHLHLAERYRSFNLIGTGSEPSAKLLRTRTNIYGIAGPVGPPVDSSLIKGEVFIESLSTNTESYNLDITVCHWDDTSSANCVQEKTYPVVLGSKETKMVDISFPAPLDPDAYAVRLELKDKSGDTVSLLRSRFIVKGKTAKIRKLHSDRYYYSTGDRVTIDALLSGSPDHYTYPEVIGSTITVTAKDLSDSSVIFSKKDTLPSFSKDLTFSEKTYSFEAPKTLNRFEICAEVHSSEGKLYDSYCVEYDSAEYQVEDRLYMLKNQALESGSGIFSLELCATDTFGMPISVAADISVNDDTSLNLILSESAQFSGCHRLSFPAVSGSEYTLTMYDQSTMKQEKFNIMPDDYRSSAADSKNGADKDNDEEPDRSSVVGYLPFFLLVIVVLIVLAIVRKRRDKYA